jgi:hypothetical protein
MGTRTKGRPVLERQMRALLIRIVRFGERRANDSDRRWAANVAGSLSILLKCDPGATQGNGR